MKTYFFIILLMVVFVGSAYISRNFYIDPKNADQLLGIGAVIGGYFIGKSWKKVANKAFN